MEGRKFTNGAAKVLVLTLCFSFLRSRSEVTLLAIVWILFIWYGPFSKKALGALFSTVKVVLFDDNRDAAFRTEI